MIDPFADDTPYANDPTHFPADKYMELALLGRIVIDQSLDGLDMVKPNDFYFGRHGELFGRMRKIWDRGEPLDPYLICDRDNELFSLLVEAQATPEPLTKAISYALKVCELAQKRRMIPLWGKAAEMSYNGADPGSILDYVAEETEKIRQGLTTSNLFDRWLGQGISAAEAGELGPIERSYIVHDLLREKSLSIFFGSPGDLKSALLMDLALCIANGLPWLQPLPVEGNVQKALATCQSRVLWLNYDQGHDDVIERLGAMARAHGEGRNVTAISHSNPPAILQNEQQARSLGKWCAGQGYRMLVVDSLLDVKGKADLQEAAMGDVLRLWRLVTEEGNLSVSIIAHNTKQSGDLYGSQFIKAKLDHLYSVTRPAGTDVVILESKKQRSFGETGKIYARWCYTHWEGTRTLRTARFLGDSTEGILAHPNTTTQDALRRILMGSPGSGFSTNDLCSVINEHREHDDQVDLNAIKNAARRLFDNDPKVGRTKKGLEYIYFYGELHS